MDGFGTESRHGYAPVLGSADVMSLLFGVDGLCVTRSDLDPHFTEGCGATLPTHNDPILLNAGVGIQEAMPSAIALLPPPLRIRGYVRSSFLNVILQNAYPLLVETALVALHAVLTAHFLWRRCTTRKTVSRADYMMAVTVATFILLTVYWSIDIYNLLVSMSNALDELAVSLNMSWGSEIPFTNNVESTWVLNLVQQGLMCVILLIGDYVVLWRTYVIFG
ncbi:unnamed protein product [Peniophora sp. CBMAI 1063]|nr:unnamed protein product [Peniophora sp. CBMAI 1063]